MQAAQHVTEIVDPLGTMWGRVACAGKYVRDRRTGPTAQYITQILEHSSVRRPHVLPTNWDLCGMPMPLLPTRRRQVR